MPLIHVVTNSLLNTGKFATNGWDAARRCKIVLLTSLVRFRRKSRANRLAIPLLVWPRTGTTVGLGGPDCCCCWSGIDTDLRAHSRCIAEESKDETIATIKSTLIVCSSWGCNLSASAMIPGNTTCRNIGRSGWWCVMDFPSTIGVVNTKIAILLQASNSPMFAATCISAQRICKNLIDGNMFKHLLRFRWGGVLCCDRAIEKVVWMACWTCWYQVWNSDAEAK